MPRLPLLAPSKLRSAAATLALCSLLAISQATKAAEPSMGQPEVVTIPSLSYPQSALRQRLAAQGKTLPLVDNSLQDAIPGRFYPPDQTDPDTDDVYPAVVALPDCDDTFPAEWISELQSHGIAVLVISPVKAHPSQAYCSEGSLDNPKHGLTYWAFDAISALDYLAKRPGIDPERITVFGYGYGGGAAQLAIYREGHARHFDHRFKALIGLRPQCMSEMNNFVPGLLIGIENDPFNPPAWCHWRMDRDLRNDRQPVRFEVLESDELIEKQATRKVLPVELSAPVVTLVTDFLSAMGIVKNIE